MTHTEAIQKAAKLLRLATSSNPHEAALAASRAQEIIDRHNLDAAGLEGLADQPSAEPIRNFFDDPLDAAKSDRWRCGLALVLAEANQCKVILHGGRLCLIGRPSDVSTIRYFYAMLCAEVERIASAQCAGNGRTFWNNFRLGMVETIGQRLKVQKAATVEAVRAEAASNPYALQIVEKSVAVIQQRAVEVEKWTKQNVPNLRAGRSSRTTYDGDARAQGRAAGHNVRLHRPGAGIGQGRTALN